MKQIVESVDSYEDGLRFSNGSMSSCLSSVLTNNDSPRKGLMYDKLHQRHLRLAVLKLDGSSFEIEVAKSGTVGEVKKAVESAFRHLPKKGPNKVSWEHLWGQFCLCHERQKLLTDTDYLSLINIKDGDQLQFVHHASTTYNLVKIQSKRNDPDSDTERPNVSGNKKGEKDRDDASSDYGSRRRQRRLTKFFKYLLPYRKLPRIDDENSNSSHKRRPFPDITRESRR